MNVNFSSVRIQCVVDDGVEQDERIPKPRKHVQCKLSPPRKYTVLRDDCGPNYRLSSRDSFSPRMSIVP